MIWRRALVGALAAILGVGIAAFTPTALRKLDSFEVREVRLEGARFLDRSEAIRTAGIGAGANVWDDASEWERRLTRHVLVERARVKRELPATLVLEVEEAAPVALLPMPTLEPVDRHGRILPIDPASHRLDLPILHASPDARRADFASSTELKLLLDEVVRLGEFDPELVRRTSELSVDERGDVLVRLYSPEVTLRYRPPLTASRLAEGLHALADALERGVEVRMIDLRFDGQVVVRGQEDA